MARPNDKPPSVLRQAKTPQKPRETTTEQLDRRKGKQMVDIAVGEVRARPQSPTANRGLLAAMALDEAITLYREAIAALRRSIDHKLSKGQLGFIENATKRYEELRTLKTLAQEDVNAEPNRPQPSVNQLSLDSEAIIAESKR